jgi:hypothetical protein
MSEWRELAERLVEVDLAIEDRESWATAPEDVEELVRLERLRDEIQAVLARRRLEAGRNPGVDVATDPRD